MCVCWLNIRILSLQRIHSKLVFFLQILSAVNSVSTDQSRAVIGKIKAARSPCWPLVDIQIEVQIAVICGFFVSHCAIGGTFL